MTKGELNTHIEKRYSECCKRSQGLSYGSFYDGYMDCYCEQQKQIEKLEQQIEKMKCCGNCKYYQFQNDAGYYTCIKDGKRNGKYYRSCEFNLEKWEGR